MCIRDRSFTAEQVKASGAQAVFLSNGPGDPATLTDLSLLPISIKEKLRSVQGSAEPLSTARYFTPLTINMVAVGEGAGNLETRLEDLAAHYDEEVEYAVGEMTEAIGPILIVVLAAVVGFFALAIFMPMWDMTKLASGGR